MSVLFIRCSQLVCIQHTSCFHITQLFLLQHHQCALQQNLTPAVLDIDFQTISTSASSVLPTRGSCFVKIFGGRCRSTPPRGSASRPTTWTYSSVWSFSLTNMSEWTHQIKVCFPSIQGTFSANVLQKVTRLFVYSLLVLQVVSAIYLSVVRREWTVCPRLLSQSLWERQRKRSKYSSRLNHCCRQLVVIALFVIVCSSSQTRRRLLFLAPWSTSSRNWIKVLILSNSCNALSKTSLIFICGDSQRWGHCVKLVISRKTFTGKMEKRVFSQHQYLDLFV